ncbi:MAG: S-methyl-5'-thioadenosine phosphorylase, partial [Planctomycetota bacterium]|nr:S-methyl-5'-thioadenosine phosphorylase [Planctomycetota bacterium]
GESPDHILESILANLAAGTAHAVALMKAAAPRIAETVSPDCGCRSALAKAIWTDRPAIDAKAVEKLGPLVDKYLGKAK